MKYLLCLIGLLPITSACGAPAGKPNIVLILADDLGYGDLGCQGVTDFKTPNIDAIARNGVRFTNGYSSCTICSPSRAGLLTGRYQTRFGHEFNLGGEDLATNQVTRAEKGLPLAEATLATHLKAAGYRTGAIGKWHLGDSADRHPLSRGFDKFFGFLGGTHGYRVEKDRRTKILRGHEKDTGDTYLTDAFAADGADFITRNARVPFFLYLSFNAVHLPLEATPEYLARVKDIKDEKRRIHAAQTIAMDDGVGRVMQALRDAGIEENTLVFFISDNGGAFVGASSNRPLRGEKHTYYEGGIRVPWMMQWKGRLAAGKVVDAPVITLDATATALAAAGIVTPAASFDGVNLLPFLRGETTTRPHETLFWRWGEHWAIRDGDWKLVRTNEYKGKASKPPFVQLFNLAADLEEQHDLAASQPAKVAALQAQWAKWNAEQAAPLWANK
ncbi:MAG: sulfatase-like hydrolase/transferase [Opitutaceae bacterium]|nr:sulfatase-like hydrolase/transferase [Opitutaceae bacterium]